MQISKNVVCAAAVVFLALFGTVFFLLGRESAPRRSLATAAVPAASQEIAEPIAPSLAAARPIAPVPAPAPAAPMPTTPATSPPTASTPMPTTPPVVAPEPPAPAIATAPLPPVATNLAATSEGAAVRDYFTKMQAIQTVGPTNDTGEFANKLLTTSMTGDSSGFDDLIKAAEAGAARARAITPPPCCVEYHQKLLGMLAESVGVVQQLKRAISTNDAAALAALAASGTSLQTRANALEDEARLIKTKFGVAR